MAHDKLDDGVAAVAVVEPVAGAATAEPVELEAVAECLGATDGFGFFSEPLDEAFVVGVSVSIDPGLRDFGKEERRFARFVSELLEVVLA